MVLLEATQEPVGVVDLTSPGLASELRGLDGRIMVLDGLLDALSRVNQVQYTVQASSDRRAALTALQDPPYCYTQAQAEAVLDMPVSWQCLGEAERLRRERDDLVARRANLRDNASDTLSFHWFG